jgi:hypothetical protein
MPGSIRRLSTPPWLASQAIRAELVGDKTCRAQGVTVCGNPTPILKLCRKLVKAGVNPTRPLHAFRGDTLCLVVRSIGEAAALEINSKGTGFIKHRASVRTASPVRRRDVQAITLAGAVP